VPNLGGRSRRCRVSRRTDRRTVSRGRDWKDVILHR
jgi:hypothetical protein